MLKRILHHSLLYTIASQVPMIVNLFLLPIVSPFLKPTDYTIYGLVLAYVGLISAFSSLGTIAVFQNSFYKNREGFKSDWSKLLGFLMIYRIAYGAVAAAVIYFTIKKSIPAESLIQLIILVLVPILFLDLTRSLGMRLCQLRHQHSRVYVSTVISGLVAASVSFYTIYHLRMGFLGWFWAQAAGGLVQFLYFGYFLYIKERIRPSPGMHDGYIKQSLKISLPLIPKEYSTYLLSSSDRVLMDWSNVERKELGLYNLAYSFAGYFEIFNSQVNQVLSPIYFDLFRKGEKKASLLVRDITFLWFAVNVFVAGSVALWSRELFHILYRNPDLNIAYPYMIIVVMAFCYRPFYVASVDRAIFSEKTLSVMRITLTAAAVNVVLNVFTLWKFGPMAAAINTFVGYSVMGILGYYLKTTSKFIGEKYYVVPTFIGLGLFTALLTFLVQFPWQWKIGISSILIVIAIFMYFKFGRKAISNINSLKLANE